MRAVHTMGRISGALAGLLIAGSGMLTATPATADGTGTAAVPATAAVSAPAHAAPAATEPQGRVVSRLTLSIRERPTTNSGYLGGIQPGAVIYLHCKVTGSNVDGNNIWYLLGNGRPGYVAARYVQNLSPVPRCA
jgi:hypothetical protein